MTTWLPDYILTRVDKMTMANSLECRVPYLDHRILDYISQLDLKEAHQDKYLLRRTMKNKMPKQIVRKRKHPFFTPISNWFEFGLKDYYESIFSESELVGDKIINNKYIKKLVKGHDKSRLINSRKLWSLMTLELCYREFILK
jgi:asparagine synthase (glutamine-hydrolysing)